MKELQQHINNAINNLLSISRSGINLPPPIQNYYQKTIQYLNTLHQLLLPNIQNKQLPKYKIWLDNYKKSLTWIQTLLSTNDPDKIWHNYIALIELIPPYNQQNQRTPYIQIKLASTNPYTEFRFYIDSIRDPKEIEFWITTQELIFTPNNQVQNFSFGCPILQQDQKILTEFYYQFILTKCAPYKPIFSYLPQL